MSGDVRWRGLSHQEIYAAVIAGRGHFASIGPQSMWTQVETQFKNVDTFLRLATNRIGPGWEGTAAEQASRNLVALGNWVAQAARSAAKTGRALEDQAQYVATMRNDLPPPPGPPPESPTSSGDPAFDLAALDDWQQEDVRRQEMAAQAVHVMETYTRNSAQNLPHIHAFAAPLAATTGAPVGVPTAPAPGAVVGGGGPFLGPGGADFPGAAGAPAPPPLGGPGGPGVPGPGGVPGPVPVPGGGVPGGGVPIPPPGQRAPGSQVPRRPFPDPLSPGPAPRPSPRPGDPGARLPGGGPGIPPGGSRGGPGVPGGGPGGPRGGPGFPGGIPGLPGGSGGAGVEPGATNRGPSGAPPPGGVAPSAGSGARGAGAGYVPGAGFGAGAGAQPREHRRPSYLLDDTDAFADDRWFTPAVITPFDPLPGTGRH